MQEERGAWPAPCRGKRPAPANARATPATTMEAVVPLATHDACRFRDTLTACISCMFPKHDMGAESERRTDISFNLNALALRPSDSSAHCIFLSFFSLSFRNV